MPLQNPKGKFEQLITDGFCLAENVLDPDMLSRLQQTTNQLLDAQSDEKYDEQRSTGSMVDVGSHPIFAELVAYPPARTVLEALGFLRPKWMSGYVISKPPESPALFWHQDWWGWNDPSSYTPLPQQLFLMYYLVDTTPRNGCLRLLRGSHLNRHRMHDEVPNAHTDELRRVTDPDHPAYQSIPEEVNVPVKAGDLVIGDSRLLHSAHANKSDLRRTVITLWYFPYFDLLSAGLRAAIARPREFDGWDKEAKARTADFIPIYEGTAEPVAWNREPSAALH
ncbi:MAG: phytanoyl-CoA dioxygenase family protein [Candidatus Latescibacterota bacterium]|nr:phytanoyl-CoA dioxygenase family protein [Candidatus Latescibacterota bacterium]